MNKIIPKAKKINNWKVFWVLSTSIICSSPALAQNYQCVLPARGDVEIKKIPHGNWGPQHDTRKWSYAAVNGKDIYRHKNGKRTLGTRCKGPGYDRGTRHTDYQGGLQDYCIRINRGWPESTGTPSCASGYTLSEDYGWCKRPARPGYWKKNRKPRGNWGPQHNTKKWSYAAVNGKDIYRHKNGKRTLGTRCKGPGYNYGTHKVDLVGQQDYCATWVNPQSESMVKASCSHLGGGFELRKVSVGTNGNLSSSSGTLARPNLDKLVPVKPSREKLVKPIQHSIKK